MVAIHTRVGAIYSIPYTASALVIMQKMAMGAVLLIKKFRNIWTTSFRLSITAFNGAALSPIAAMQRPRTTAKTTTERIALFVLIAFMRLDGTEFTTVTRGL